MVFQVDWWTVPNEHANQIISNSHSAVDMGQSASCVEKAGCDALTEFYRKRQAL